MRALGTTLRVVGFVLLSLVLLVASTLVTVIVVGRSQFGRRKLVSVLVPTVQSALTGRLGLGGIEGSLTRGLVLRDVVIDDAEGNPAIALRRVELGYNLAALWGKTLDLTDVTLAGKVYLRRHADGTLNLATLAKPRSTPPPPALNRAYRVFVRRLHGQLEVAYQGQPDEPVPSAHGRLELEGSADIGGDTIEATLKSLALDTTAPAPLALRSQGGVKVDGGQVAANRLQLSLDARGEALRSLLPTVPLQGAWHLEIGAHGPTDKLGLRLLLQPPTGRLTVDGALAVGERLSWSAKAKAADIDPAAAVAGTPHGRLQLDADLHGEGSTVQGAVRQLLAEAAGARLEAHGTLDRAGGIAASGQLAAPDLRQLATLGVRGLAGRLDARVKLLRDEEGHFEVDSDARGRRLAYGKERLARLDLRVHLRDLLGEARLFARGLASGGVRLSSLDAHLRGNPRALSARLKADGPDGTQARLAIQGRPELSPRGAPLLATRLRGADLRIDQLELARGGERWRSTAPAALSIHRAVTLAPLILSSRGQGLRLEGRFDPTSEAVAAELHGSALDLAALGRLLRLEGELPKSAIELVAKVSGTSRRPKVEAHLGGRSEANRHLGLGSTDYRVEALLENERLRASCQVADGPKRLDGTLDLGVAAGPRPIAAELALHRFALASLKPLLPKGLQSLAGDLEAGLHVAGTLARPEADLTVEAHQLALVPDLDHTSLQLAVGYHHETLDGKLTVRLKEALKGDAGALQLEAGLPLTMSALANVRRLREELLTRIPLTFKLGLAHLDLEKFPYGVIGIPPPVESGVVDLTFSAEGTLPRLRANGDLLIAKLVSGKSGPVRLAASLQYADKLAKLAVDGQLRGATLLELHGHAPLDALALARGQPLAKLPLFVDGTVPGYDLSKIADLIPALGGNLRARLRLRGTMDAPQGSVETQIAALKMGSLRFTTCALNADYSGSVFTGRVEARESKGGRLHGLFTLPNAADEALVVELDAVRFPFDFENRSTTNPRLVKGILDANLRASGVHGSPNVNGWLHFTRGKLAFPSDPMLYEDVDVELTLRPDKLALKNASARVSDGSLHASGEALLDQLKPQKLELVAEAKRFPVAPGAFGAWVDAVVRVRGQAKEGGMSGTVTVEEGTVHLPELTSARKLQSVGPLADVVFVDPAARQARAERRADEAAPAENQIVAKIPGPFHVRGKEISAEVRGNVTVTTAGTVARVTGDVETMGGWIELLGRRYTIDRARLGFGGEAVPDPLLNIRITRDLSTTTIAVEVHGSASRPKVSFSSDPPIYDESQVIAAILSGDPASQRVDDRSLQQKATGAVSGFVIGKIKDQIAPSLPIDVIKVDPGSEGATGLGDTRLEIGKYITETIYVSYIHQFGSILSGQRVNTNEGQLEWRFLKHFALETAFGDAAVGRVNLYWMLRY